MASRKDGKGRVLRKGEHYRRIDGRYSYIYRDPMENKEQYMRSHLLNSERWKNL